MVEAVSAKFICIVDESKLSSRGLGPNFPLPVEITPFCHEHTRRVIEGLPSLKGMLLVSTLISFFHSYSKPLCELDISLQKCLYVGVVART